MKKIFFFIIIFTIVSTSLIAQEYKTAVGIRLGPNTPAITAGFTIKHFVNEQHALEGIVGMGDGFGIGGLYEWHRPIAAVEHLQWFAGAGAYVAFKNSETMIGAAGIVGLDYKFETIPLNISLDWKPELNLLTKVGYEASGVGVSARFTF